MTTVLKRPLPRQRCQVATGVPQNASEGPRRAVPMTPAPQHNSYRIPVATPVSQQSPHRPSCASATPQVAPHVVRPRSRVARMRAQQRRVKNSIVVGIGIVLISVAAIVLLLLLFSRPPDAGGKSAQGSGLEKERSAPPIVVPTRTLNAWDAVDVYEFLKVMQGTPFLAEGDMERLLGKPYNVAKSPKGEIRTHVHTGGVVQYQLSKHNPRMIGSLALKKAGEQSRDEIKRGDFETASRLLRVREHREYCLLMLRQQTEKRVFQKPAISPKPKQTPTPPRKAVA